MTQLMTIGLDLGDQTSHLCILDEGGDVVERTAVATTKQGLERFFSKRPCCLVVVEAGLHSRWVSSLLERLGHRVLVGNPRHVRLIYGSTTKCDQFDAEALARLGRYDPRLLHPVKHRSDDAHIDLGLIKSRDILVATRKNLVNHVRASVKVVGERLAKCDTDAFAKKVREDVPDELRAALEPVLTCIEEQTKQIKTLEKIIDRVAACRYPEVTSMMQVAGVGPITSLAFVLTLEDRERFKDARMVGAFLGLVPRRDQSGARDPHLRITKAGNGFLRRLLVNCAHYIVGPLSPDSDLKRFGLRVLGTSETSTGRRKKGVSSGSSRKKKAVIAVARKLAVLLYRLWQTGAEYVAVGHGAKA